MLGDNRKIDNLGRICIPKEMRKKLNIGDTDQLEVICDGDKIMLRKKEFECVFCHRKKNLTEFNGKYICKECRNELNKSSTPKYEGERQVIGIS